MAGNILSAKIQVTAPGVEQTFTSVAAATGKAELALKKLPNSAYQSTLALTNLGRVVQDAPFGFLGIANNLNPLLESFQRLRSTTGSTGTALKALGSSLLGAGGLGFALSIVSTALIVFGDKLFGTKKTAEETEPVLTSLAKAQKKFKEELDAAAKSVVSQAGDLKDLATVLSDVSNQYLTLADSIVKQGIARALFSQKEGVVEKILSNEIQNRLKVQQVLNKTKEFELKTATDLSKIKPLRIASDADLKSTGFLLSENEQKLFDINKLAESLGLNFDQFIKKAKGIKDVKFEYDALKAIFNDLISIQKVFGAELEKQADIRFKIGIDFSTAKGRAISGSAFTDFSKQVKNVSDPLQKELDRLMKSNPILIAGNNFTLDMTAANNAIERQLKELWDTVKGTAMDVFAGIGETIGEAVSGGDFRKGIQSFVNAIAEGISSLGKQFIKIGLLAVLAKNAFTKLFSNPALSIAVGVALVAASAALKNALSGGISGARAAGGPVKKGGVYLVGENGPELFTPDTGGKITSNSSLRNTGMAVSGGGMNIRVIGEFVQRGYDMVAVLRLVEQKLGRLA